MGCASSKPSSSSKEKHKKNIKSKQNVENGSRARVDEDLNSPKINGHPAAPSESKPINLSADLVEQIEANSQQVINFIGQIVHRELNAELISHRAPQADMAAVVLAASVAKENDDLIQDVAAKAVFLLTSKNLNYRPSTYQILNESLKATEYLFKNQTNKNRIIDLTVDTIENSLDAINQEVESQGTEFRLVDFLRKNHSENGSDQQLTPPQTPERINANKPNQSTPFIDWENAQLLSRAQATEVARILFLSNKARPVVHASPKTKDAYVVNKQVDDTEIALSRDEIDEILNRFDEQPKYIELVENYHSINLSPITPQSDRVYINETPVLSSFGTRSANLTNNLNELADASKNEELTEVTQDDTIQFASDTQESIKTSQVNIEYLPDGLVDQQADNESISEDKNPSLFVTETNTVITENCVISCPADTDNLENNQLDPTLKQSLLDDRFYNNDSFKTEAPVNGEEENMAATIIQASFRGYEARQTGEVNMGETMIDNSDVNQAELDSGSERAAIKIQATYRGFKTRKELHQQKDNGPENNQ